VFGNLGENKLYKLSSQLEQVLIDDGEDWPKPLIDEIKMTLKDAMNRIHTALQNNEVVQANTISNGDIVAALQKVLTRIEDFDSTAEEAVDDLLAQVGQDKTLAISLEQLQTHLGSYDFDSALSLVSDIIKTHQV